MCFPTDLLLHKPGIKVVQDMLTKRWIIIKKDKHLGDLTFKQFLNTCRKPSSARTIEAIKTLSEAAMIMVAMRKLKEANEKWKKEKKGINDKHNSKKRKIQEGLQIESV
jgi:hypothetical protein